MASKTTQNSVPGWDATLRVVENQTSILGSKEGQKWPKSLDMAKKPQDFIFFGPRCLWGPIYGLASLKLTETLGCALISKSYQNLVAY